MASKHKERSETLDRMTQLPAAPTGRSIWDPFSRGRAEIDRLVDDFWSRPLAANLTRQIQSLAGPAMELKEMPESYELYAELPGIKASDIDVKLSDGLLRISGEKREHREEKQEGYVFSERSYGCFERSIELPRGIDTDRISAKAENGVLHIHLPKNAEARQSERRISVSG